MQYLYLLKAIVKREKLFYLLEIACSFCSHLNSWYFIWLKEAEVCDSRRFWCFFACIADYLYHEPMSLLQFIFLMQDNKRCLTLVMCSALLLLSCGDNWNNWSFLSYRQFETLCFLFNRKYELLCLWVNQHLSRLISSYGCFCNHFLS